MRSLFLLAAVFVGSCSVFVGSEIDKLPDEECIGHVGEACTGIDVDYICNMAEQCVISECGDGIHDPRDETCDDGDNNDDNGCTEDCEYSCEGADDCDDENDCDGMETCDVGEVHQCIEAPLIPAVGTYCEDANNMPGECMRVPDDNGVESPVCVLVAEE